MVHVAALPGTPANVLPVREIIRKADEEAKILADGGVDAILIENMHDVPYLRNTVGPEVVTAMTAVACRLREQCNLPMGIQILAAANKEALAVAQAAGLNFIRAEGFVFAHVADEGLIEGCAGDLLRYRKKIGAEDIKIFTDIRKKHSSHAITADISLEEQVKTAEYFRSDGIIITGRSTGEEALVEDVQIARQATSLPVLIGSGITAENIKEYWSFANVFIVGSFLKEKGNWKNPVSAERLKQLMNTVTSLKNSI
jgi:membrane complex biogenesis BtpA family protein